MLLTMLFDESEDDCVSALFQVGPHVLQLKQRPTEGRLLDADKEQRQEQAMEELADDGGQGGAGPAAVPAGSGGGTAAAAPAAAAAAAAAEYDSAFPNVGLVVWQAGFVLAEWLARAAPLGPWPGRRVLELGCGTGQLGIVLALAGAAVTLTDLAHITPLTQDNVDLNAARCAVAPAVQPFMWGTDASALRPPAAPPAPAGEEQQQQRQRDAAVWDAVVAADVLYEPQYYDILLSSLMQLCPAPQAEAGGGSAAAAAGAAEAAGEAGEAGTAEAAAPQVFLCYRVRRYKEHGFEARAARCGFDVEAVPVEQLHPDYRCGGYRLIRLTRTRAGLGPPGRPAQ